MNPRVCSRHRVWRARTVHQGIDMMKTVKHTFTSIGDHSGEIARTIGSGTAGLARRFGGGTASLARRVGPRRALIGFAVAAVAVGGSIVLVRYLRARNAERLATDGPASSTDRANGTRSSRVQRSDVHASHQG
jgi:hypothetical protein